MTTPQAVTLAPTDVLADISAHFPLGEVEGRFPFTDNGRSLILSHDFRYVDVLDGTPIDVLIPKGFTTDFNSTPRPMWVWFPPWECPEAGVIHDGLYRNPGTFSRGDIDRIHRRLMEIKGERKSKRTAAWWGIRLGGWVPWHKYREAEQVKGVAGPTDAA
jgi:hypothetical protein